MAKKPIITKADIRELWKQGEIVCVTINGFVRKDGRGVMGRGNALAMSQLIPELSLKLGEYLRKEGLKVGFIYDRIIAFPVKPKMGVLSQALPKYRFIFSKQACVPGFACKASIDLIIKSAKELVVIANSLKKNIYLPIPGVGNGELNITDLEPVFDILAKSKYIKLVSL